MNRKIAVPLWTVCLAAALLLLSILIVVFCDRGSSDDAFVQKGAEEQSESGSNLAGQQTYVNEELGFALDYSADEYIVSAQPRSGFDASFHRKGNETGVEAIGVVNVLRHETEFQTFGEFSQDALRNFIPDLIRANNVADADASDEEIALKLEELPVEGRSYSFEIDNYNGADVILHTRNFHSWFGDVRMMFVWLGPGEYLTIGGEGIGDFDFTGIRLLDRS